MVAAVAIASMPADQGRVPVARRHTIRHAVFRAVHPLGSSTLNYPLSQLLPRPIAGKEYTRQWRHAPVFGLQDYWMPTRCGSAERRMLQ